MRGWVPFAAATFGTGGSVRGLPLVRLESRLDASLVARFGKHELALKRCHTAPQSGDSKKQAAATAAEKAPRQAPRRKGSDWMEGFDLKKSPPLWQAARASGARRAAAPAESLS